MILILALLTVFLVTQQPVDCTITASDREGNHATCKGRNPNPVCEGRNEPECAKLTLTWDGWPEVWEGSRKTGTIYRVIWQGGEHKPLPSATYCKQEFERRHKASRAGINDGVRHLSYFIPEGCNESLLQNR